MSNNELKSILEAHLKYLANEDGGCCANLTNADLKGVNLSHSDLRNVDLMNANLNCTNLSDADLGYANIWNANLNYANLNYTNFSYADLSYANLIGTDLMNANFRMTVNIDKVVWNIYTKFYQMQCPEEGAFIGWKKAHNQIVKLEICEDALRSSATSRKCRCSSAKVLAIENLDGSRYGDVIKSNYDPSFLYKVGEIVKVENFDTDRWNECAPGIHFFLTREEAVKYCC